MCASWFLLTERGFDYHLYYLLSARELEEQFISNPVKTVSRGGIPGSGKQIAFQISGLSPMKVSRWSGLMSARWIARIVILLFVLLYVATLAQLIN